MSTLKRFFTETVGEEVLLSGEEFRHAKGVLRLGVGDEVVLFDGSGKEYTAIIAKAEKQAFVLRVTGERVTDKEPKTEVYLLIGTLKGDKTELVVQKATELGVSKIGVFSSRYVSAFWSDSKTERLKKVAREAAKQCLRATVPTVEYFSDFGAALASAENYQNKFFACEFAKRSDRELDSASGSCALVVGSEGGFTEEEFALAKEHGFAGVTLGRRILRAETAAIALLSVVMYTVGELK